MASLTELLPRLEEGAVLQSSRGEVMRLVGPGKVQWIKSKGYYFEEESIALADLRTYKDLWDWHVIGVQDEH